MTSIKQERVSGRIRRILSELLVREVADPRLGGVTITNVEIDPELMYARVYVNALGEEERAGEVLAALKHAKSFLRREVGRRVHLRNTPDLIFKWDETLARGERIYAILDDLDLPSAPPPADDDAAADEWADEVDDGADEWASADLDDFDDDEDTEALDDRV
ncbi:MAG: 30S ribosome-binding factor RbfA [Candidatus Flexifilum sp.]|jgi:ribosome-binding factor A